ncbi:MAG: DNA translocase FtsK 4TM domain-containing protein [Deltaproteobacteria bacterium]|nr:DNA translocase FtsK 4TM domain-containing protein [Deltaproteobacteria bacterium]
MFPKLDRRAKEITALCLFGLALLLLLSLATYNSGDPTLFTASSGQRPVQNAVGIVGANLAAILLVAVGVSAYWLPTFLLFGTLGVFLPRAISRPLLLATGCTLLVIASSGLAALYWPALRLWGEPLPGSGGILGLVLKKYLQYYLKPTGAYLLLWLVAIVAILLATPISLARAAFSLNAGFTRLWQTLQDMRNQRSKKEKKRRKTGTKAPVVKTQEEKKREVPKQKQAQFEFMAAEGEFRLPDIALLDPMDQEGDTPDQESLVMNSRILEKKLADFGVAGEVTEVSPGPVITMYEYKPAPGVKISKIVGLADDLALALKAASIRIVAPIPQKGTLGIEIPNVSRQPVVIRDVVDDLVFSKKKGRLLLALGKDTTGKPMVTDLARMPHLLIAGATGTGKSVCLNAIIISLLYQATPDEARLLLIDPKRIELTAYEGIPHLLHPVVTDAKKANIGLKWAVAEMERRYELLSLKGVRSIERYNQMVLKAKKSKPRLQTPPPTGESEEAEEQTLPYLIVIIDELADLMIVASRDVEESIIRLAQMARAAGIHLILATQRPSVDVLTGIIKANISARISFQVSSRTDSRTILDANGAEALLGAGDMLMLPPGTAKLQRIHGAYASETEIRRITDFLRKQRKPDYDDTILNYKEKSEDWDTEDEIDEKYEDAVNLVMETRQASISMIQRRLRVGYNRAARMIEMMERQGLVSGTDGSKPREVLPPK